MSTDPNKAVDIPVQSSDNNELVLSGEDKIDASPAPKTDSAQLVSDADKNVPDRFSRRKNPPPPGMTLSAYKKQLRREKFEDKKVEWSLKKKEKKKEKQAAKRKLKELTEDGQIEKPTAIPFKRKQIIVDIDVVIDCGFDEMMKPEEVTSLGTQLLRCYAENRKAEKSVGLKITSFNKSLKHRFTTTMKNQHLNWKNVDILETDYVAPECKDNWVYLSSDSPNLIEKLEPGHTYIVGGIVDKGRYKNLCKDKAEQQGIKTGRLPIDEFVRISGRRVLTTNHVFEILLQWLKTEDWKLAFEAILPQRKLVPNNNLSESISEQAAESISLKTDENSQEKPTE